MAPRKGAAGGSGPLCADVGGLQARGGRRPRTRPLRVAVGAALPAATLLAGWGIAEAGHPASASAPAFAPAPVDSGAGAFRGVSVDKSHLGVCGSLQV